MDNLTILRNRIEGHYKNNPTGCGSSFGELLCYEIHSKGLTFIWLANKWGISVTTLGELIYDHCKRLEKLPRVNHQYAKPGEGERPSRRAPPPPSSGTREEEGE